MKNSNAELRQQLSPWDSFWIVCTRVWQTAQKLFLPDMNFNMLSFGLQEVWRFYMDKVFFHAPIKDDVMACFPSQLGVYVVPPRRIIPTWQLMNLQQLDLIFLQLIHFQALIDSGRIWWGILVFFLYFPLSFFFSYYR